MALTKLNYTGQGVVPHAKMPTGSVLQTVHATTTTAVSTNSTDYTSTNLTANITPKSSNSKILVTTFLHCKIRGDHDHGMGFKITRAISGGATSDAYASPTPQDEYRYSSDGSTSSGTIDVRGRMSWSFFDTPSTTSACTYLVYYRSHGTANSNSPAVQSDASPSMITLQEIAG